MKTFLFNPNTLELIEKSSMGKPLLEYDMQLRDDKYYKRHDLYEQHIKSLLHYTCHPSCVKAWEGRTEIQENEFEVKDIPVGCGIPSGTYAYPIQQQQESEDEIWKEMLSTMNVYKFYMDDHIKFLKKHFTITKK